MNKETEYYVKTVELKKVKYGNKIIERHIVNNTIQVGLNWHIQYHCPSCNNIIKKRYSHYINEKKCKKCNTFEKHGVTHVTKLESMKNKTKKTKLEKYGNENYNNINKTKKTKLEKHNDENYNNVNKTKKTKLEKYGNENYNNIDKIKETQFERYKSFGFNTSKQQETMLKKYNVKYSWQSKSIMNKSKKTKLERYGNENYNNRDEAKKTCLCKYGIECLLKNNYSKIKRDKFFKNLDNRVQDTSIPLFNKHEYINVKTKYKWECNTCNTTFEDHLDDGKIPRCPTCFPKSKSKGEQELSIYCKELGLDIIENDREIIKPYEIDICIPSHNLAIEYNGLYWHNTDHVDKWYHQRKVELAYRKGVRLLHVWEHEDIEEVKEKISYYLDNVNEYIKIEKPRLYNIKGHLIWI